MDGLEDAARIDVCYPESLSRHNRQLHSHRLENNQIDCSPHMYKRTVKKKVDRRGRFRTQPVTFSEIKEVDEDKVEDPLTGLSGNSSDFSDNEKWSSMQEVRMRCSTTGLTRSQSGRRQRSGSRGHLDIVEMTREEVAASPGDQENTNKVIQDSLPL